MRHISELSEIIGRILKLNKSRSDCFAKMIWAILTVKTVNLREIAVAFQSNAEIDSRYKRLKRFIRFVQIDTERLACWLVELFFPKDIPFYITLDRTNWFWGKTKLNVLLLGIAHEGMAIPVMWYWLDKAGNASALEHQFILERFINLLGKERILGILADREFASHGLFAWLNKEKVPFYIRIKEDSAVNVGKTRMGYAWELFKDLKTNHHQCFAMTVWILGQKLYVSASRSEQGELMIVATNRDPRRAIAIYLRRWEIETLFQSLKGRGFHFETTHVTQLERIDHLMMLLAVTFCFAHKIGEWRARIKPIVLNRYGGSIRPQYSYFRYGLDFTRDLILKCERHVKPKLLALIQLLDPDNSSNQNLIRIFL